MKLIKKLFSFFWDRSLLIFAIIGGANTVLTYAGSFLLENFAHWSFLASTLTMYAVCSVISFYFNRKYSFKSKAPLGQSILRFTVVIAVCYTLSYLGTYFALPWLRDTLFPNIGELGYNAIRLLGLQVLFTLLNYIGQRLWAFKAVEEKAE